MRPGMFLEVRLDRPQRVSEITVASHTPNFGVPIELYGLGADGRWRQLSAAMTVTPRPREDLRRAAIRYLKRLDFTYILAPTEYTGVWQIGQAMVGNQAEWGVAPANQRGFVHMLRIP